MLCCFSNGFELSTKVPGAKLTIGLFGLLETNEGPGNLGLLSPNFMLVAALISSLRISTPSLYLSEVSSAGSLSASSGDGAGELLVYLESRTNDGNSFESLL